MGLYFLIESEMIFKIWYLHFLPWLTYYVKKWVFKFFIIISLNNISTNICYFNVV